MDEEGTSEENKYQTKLIKSEYLKPEEINTDIYLTSAPIDTNHQGEYTPRADTTGVLGFYWSGIDTIGYNDWKQSYLNLDLNKSGTGGLYLPNLGDYANLIYNKNWFIGGNTYGNLANTSLRNIYNNEIGVNRLKPGTHNNCVDGSPSKVTCREDLLLQRNKIGLMYVSDYGYAADSSLWSDRMQAGTKYASSTNWQNNWLFNGINEWTITRGSAMTDRSFLVSGTLDECQGCVLSQDVRSFIGAVRPSLYLVSNTKYLSGDGSLDNPIVISSK